MEFNLYHYVTRGCFFPIVSYSEFPASFLQYKLQEKTQVRVVICYTVEIDLKDQQLIDTITKI